MTTRYVAMPGEPPEIVGREEELTVLRSEWDRARSGGTGLVVVEGAPGVGKTHLLDHFADLAGGRFVVWGRCLEGDGTPTMWPWVHAVTAILAGLPDHVRNEQHSAELRGLLAPDGAALDAATLPHSVARFRLFERIVGLVAAAAARRPLMLIIDDLHWADAASLHLLEHLVKRLPPGTMLIGALRTQAPAPVPDLTRALAAASGVPGHRRLRLEALDPDEVCELVRREIGRTPSPDLIRIVYARTAGNPFFVRELARLLVDRDARVGVPSSVRDVVRDRTAGLPDDTRYLLRLGALIGRQIDVRVLADAADLDVAGCLDRLQPVEALDLLEPVPGDPYSYRYTHDLVRESIAAEASPNRVPYLHLRVADALERLAPDGDPPAERLAHHLWAAGPLADPARTARALIRAGRNAAAKSAFEAAERQLLSAVRLARAANVAEAELSALTYLQALIGVQPSWAASVEQLKFPERAADLAAGLGRGREAAANLFTYWSSLTNVLELGRAGEVALRLRRRAEESSDPVERAYGWYAWGLHQQSVGRIGESCRYLNRLRTNLLGGLPGREDDPIRHDLRILLGGMIAESTALNGEVGAARTLFDQLEAEAGDDPHAITAWATLSARTAALVGEPEWALYASARGIAVESASSFAWHRIHQRLAGCWARAVVGLDPDGAAVEARQIIATNLVDPPITSISSAHALLAEMRLAVGALDEATEALDRSDHFLERFGQRYAEGLNLLLRARLLRASGQASAVVRVAAERARALSVEREAYLYAQRADDLLDEIDGAPW
ncbi:ATP-binding protein [Cryptosporangium phraense]|uniref:AAA family ATPase n=1 Tax=Cryptosporangium phraense TaxID=2593070 RepID=A0A545APR4_9ACTN|nr:AAA family ATPase [Cryptosporangium phraense]TQS43317.1 AAA family ATPase [Cryptosporangium phraense]